MELIPCPFCGSTPIFPDPTEVFGTCYDAGCEECGIASVSLQITDYFDYPKNDVYNSWDKKSLQYGIKYIEKVKNIAVNMWNKRVK